MHRRLFLIGCGVAGTIALIAMWPPRPPTPPSPTNAPSSNTPRPSPRIPAILPTDPVRGLPEAPLTIIEFGDLTCPSCIAATAVLAELRRQYGPQLRIVWKDFPVLDRLTNSRRMHVAARCAQRQERFWEYHDGALAEQPRDDAARIAIATRLGLDAEAFTTCLTQEHTATLVDAGTAEAAALDLRSAPAFSVNGEWLEGHPTIDDFRTILDRALR